MPAPVMNDFSTGRTGLDAERGAGPELDPGGLSAGVSSSLSELERKLRLLENELASVTSGRAPTGVAVPSPARPEPGHTPAPPDATQPAPERAPSGPARGPRPTGSQLAGEGLEIRAGDLDLLLRFRDQLERYSRALVTDYGRLLAHLGIDVALPPLPPPPPAPPTPAGGATRESESPFAPAAEFAVDEPHEYTGRGLVYEDILLEGAVVLELGPVADLAAAREFEAQLAKLPAAHARVRAFEGTRVAFDLRLGESVRLVAELRGVLRHPFVVLDAAPGRLSIVLGDQAHGG
jgi:hypothetical protein